MRNILLNILQLLIFSDAFAQKTDSIRYSNGYLYFHEYGTGEPIIILTGGPGADYLQLEDVAVTSSKGYRCILLEQRGTGRSMPQPFDTSTINLNTALFDLNHLLDFLKIKQTSFLGHSWGAMLAMSFASSYPSRVKSLILIDPGPFKLDTVFRVTFAHNREARLTTTEKLTRDSIFSKIESSAASPEDKELYDKLDNIPLLYDKTKVNSLISRINKGAFSRKMASLMYQSLIKNGFNLSKPLSELNKAVYIITGSQDPGGFISYEIKMILPKSKLFWIDKAGHFPMFEQPDVFYSTLFKVLTENKNSL
jgi:proline iminopeptidase